MHPLFRPLKAVSRKNVLWKLYSESPTKPMKNPHFVYPVSSFCSGAETLQNPDGEPAFTVQTILKTYRDSPTRKIEFALDQCNLSMTNELVLNVLKRHSSDWKSAYYFFIWVRKKSEVTLGSEVYNQILDILGKMRRFEEVNQVFNEMSKREGFANEETYDILVKRHAAAHKVDEAIGFFHRRKEFGLKVDLVAFQKLLMYLCRYRHVEVAETLLHSKGEEFGVDIKTMNIVLNGWCVLRNVREAKRFWKDIIRSKCKPDLFTYGTFIYALSKKGKLGTVMKLYRGMWEEGFKPDVVICNCVIDALCFKKKIPEALEVFKEMNERGCLPNVATYNSLIKHLCKIRRMDKVTELLDEMQEKKGSCLPDNITFNYLLKSVKKPEEIQGVLQRMERNGCKLDSDTYNMVLKLYADCDCEEKVKYTWDEMEKIGVGFDRRSYTIMMHWLHDKGRYKDSLRYFSEMTSKGMVPEQRTSILVNAMKVDNESEPKKT